MSRSSQCIQTFRTKISPGSCPSLPAESPQVVLHKGSAEGPGRAESRLHSAHWTWGAGCTLHLPGGGPFLLTQASAARWGPPLSDWQRPHILFPSCHEVGPRSPGLICNCFLPQLLLGMKPRAWSWPLFSALLLWDLPPWSLPVCRASSSPGNALRRGGHRCPACCQPAFGLLACLIPGSQLSPELPFVPRLLLVADAIPGRFWAWLSVLTLGFKTRAQHWQQPLMGTRRGCFPWGGVFQSRPIRHLWVARLDHWGVLHMPLFTEGLVDRVFQHPSHPILICSRRAHTTVISSGHL